MESHLASITSIIEEYNNLSVPSAPQVSALLRKLTSELFFLEKYRADYHTDHNTILLNRNGSVAAAQIEANDKVKELYLLRRIMNAAYRVVDAMRSNISTLNKES